VNRLPFVCALSALLFLSVARSQGPKPSNGEELFNSLEQLNVDPLNKLPSEKPAPKKDKAQGQTEITADNAEFNNKTHIAIFIGEVIVKNPEFNVNCDKLTAYLKHDEKPAPAAGATPKPATPKPATPAAGPDAAPKSKGGGLEKAIAEMAKGGKVIITQEKKEADGSISQSIGKGDKAVYNAVTGEVTLTGWPEAKQGMNSSVATDEGTVMIMTRDGNMRTIGRSKVMLQDSSNDKPAR
jgi:lipopolysaccharide export system protein LptA